MLQDIDDQFERNGFAVIPDLVDASSLETLREHYDAVLSGAISCRDDRRQARPRFTATPRRIIRAPTAATVSGGPTS